MNTALSWIKAYVPNLACEDQEFSDAMTLTGTKVEGYHRLDQNLEKIVVGQILSIERHPDADKLIICQVDVGTEAVQIVTGAKNVAVRDKIPVVLDGGRVAGGHDGGPLPAEGIKIKAGKLRGVPSNGMLCSIEELGSSKEMYPDAPEDGIYILPDDAPVGADAPTLLGLRDTVFEFEITSNRVDCYSVMGIAREAAATFKQEFVPPQEDAPGNDEDVNDYISIEVTDPDLCSRYCARVCKNIKIGPSPAWMQRRLAASGIRPINNLVDITNYVMEEYGHPMHAYDLSQVADSKIIVRRAKDGDTFITLDGQSRKLDSEMLMICDGQKEIGIAGIMGGENSKITDDVTTVLLEAAVFNGANIRKSAKRLGLRTEASGKFEKGLDPRNAEAAVNRACRLIEELGCGEVVGGIADAKEEIKPLRRIAFIPDKINHALGTDISKQDMLDIFSREGLSYEEESEVLVIPSFRQDLEGFVDIVEEVARFYGYDKIPSTLPKGEATSGKLPYKLRIEKELREAALSCGFSQGMSYSFESPKVFDKLLLTADDERRKVVTITNPMGEDFSIMRSISLNGMLTSLSFNYNRRNKNVKLFEMGNIYLAEELPLKELPEERMQLTLGFYGDGDFYTMKGVVEAILERVGMTAAGKNRSRLTFSAQGDYPFLHPGRKAEVLWDGKLLGYLGEVHPQVQENYEIGARTYVAVLDIPAILPATTFDRKYESLARFPAVTRDISMVVPSSVTAGEIEQVISQRGGKLLEDYALFDLYEGEQIQAGYKSMAYSITLRAKDRTLEESDAAGVMKKLLKGLEQLGAQLRQV